MTPEPAFDAEKWRLGFELFLFFWNLAIGVFLWFSNADKVTHTRIDTMEDDMLARVGDLGVRINRIEVELQHVPTHNDIGKVYERLAGVESVLRDLSSASAEVRGEFKAMRGALDRIQSYMMENK